MVKHIVLFKLKETLSQEEKLKVMNDWQMSMPMPFIRIMSLLPAS